MDVQTTLQNIRANPIGVGDDLDNVKYALNAMVSILAQPEIGVQANYLKVTPKEGSKQDTMTIVRALRKNPVTRKGSFDDIRYATNALIAVIGQPELSAGRVSDATYK